MWKNYFPETRLFSKEKREKYDAGFGTGDEPVPGLSAEVRSGPGAWKDGIL